MSSGETGAGALPSQVAADAEYAKSAAPSRSNDPAPVLGQIFAPGLRLNDDEDPIAPNFEYRGPSPSAPPALDSALVSVTVSGATDTTSLLAGAIPPGVGTHGPVPVFIPVGIPSAPPIVVYAAAANAAAATPRDPRIDDSRIHVHWRSLFVSAGLWASIVAIAVVLSQGASSDQRLAASVCAGVFAAIYLVEFCLADTRKYLSNMQSVGSAEEYVRKVYVTPPQPVFWIQCYHYERRVTYTTVRDSDGKERTETTFTTVRVDTYRETKPFRFDLWRDVSDPMPLIRGYPLTKLHCGKTLVFADALSRARFDAAHAELVERNRFRDDHYETGWKLQVDGFSSHVLASADGTVTPCGVSLPIYLMLSLLGLSYPYRLWLERKCVRAHYRFTKEVRCLV